MLLKQIKNALKMDEDSLIISMGWLSFLSGSHAGLQAKIEVSLDDACKNYVDRLKAWEKANEDAQAMADEMQCAFRIYDLGSYVIFPSVVELPSELFGHPIMICYPSDDSGSF